MRKPLRTSGQVKADIKKAQDNMEKYPDQKAKERFKAPAYGGLFEKKVKKDGGNQMDKTDD